VLYGHPADGTATGAERVAGRLRPDYAPPASAVLSSCSVRSSGTARPVSRFCWNFRCACSATAPPRRWTISSRGVSTRTCSGSRPTGSQCVLPVTAAKPLPTTAGSSVPLPERPTAERHFTASTANLAESPESVVSDDNFRRRGTLDQNRVDTVLLARGLQMTLPRLVMPL